MTRTVEPFGSGVGDQAIYVSEPPLILTSTSPGPADPLVATVRTPMQPMSEVSGATRQPPFRLSRLDLPGRNPTVCRSGLEREAAIPGRENSPWLVE